MPKNCLFICPPSDTTRQNVKWHKAVFFFFFFFFFFYMGACMRSHSQDMPGRHKTASSPIGILLNGHLRCHVITLAPHTWVRAWDSPLRLEEWVSLTHKTRLLGFPSSCIKQSQLTDNYKTELNPTKTANSKTANQIKKYFGNIYAKVNTNKDYFIDTFRSPLYHFHAIQVFHTSISWWFFTELWVTASLLQ